VGCNESLAEVLIDSAGKYPDINAWEYLGHRKKFPRLLNDVQCCAEALTKIGMRAGDRIVLSLPNCPQAMTLMYAANYIGAVAVFTHPLSAPEEMDFYLSSSKARFAVTLYQFYDALKSVFEAHHVKIILTSPLDMHFLPAFSRVKRYTNILSWRAFRKLGKNGKPKLFPGKADTDAVILYSGGTTGIPKGVVISNGALNALARDTVLRGANIEPRFKMLAVLPIFHVFGLGICIHTPVFAGLTAVLVPQFTAKSAARIISKRKINYIVGVPTLFEAMLRVPGTEKLNYRSLRGVFSGGDTLPLKLKQRMDAFLSNRGSPVPVREGYGLTETTGACCLTPIDGAPEGSIGRAYDSVVIKITALGEEDELPRGEEGEICISGDLIMSRYDGDTEETAASLSTHGDGKLWLRTGDLGVMDDEGFVYFRGRIKRIIVSAGYNVYPYHVEMVLSACEIVKEACVVGVPDDYRMERVRAAIVLKEDIPHEEAEKILRERMKRALAPQLRPREYVFLPELPKTKLGKTDYLKLSEKK